MSSVRRELVFLILQFLDEAKYKDVIHKLEKESGFYFNMKYFGDMLMNGEWDELEKYLLGFTNIEDNHYSMMMFYEIYKQKYLEALDRGDRSKAVEILRTDLKSVLNLNGVLYEDLALLLTLNNFRENERFSKYGDTGSSRANLSVELKKLIEANPLFRYKLQFPSFESSRLRKLINQSLNWQHRLCKNTRSNPDIKTLSVGHMCGQPSGRMAPTPIGLTAPSSSVKRPRTATDISSVDEQIADSDLAWRRSQPLVIGVEVGTNAVAGRDVPVTAMVRLNGENQSFVHANPSMGKYKIWIRTEIIDPSELCSIRLPLPDNMPTARIMRLTYTNSGSALLALASNAVHQLWRWEKNEHNVAGKATASVAPRFWRPQSGVLMTNEIGEANPKEAVPCFALSKNDSYVISTSGGRISVFNLLSFKTLRTLESSPSAATSLLFHPRDNNIIAIGMDDSTIKIFNVQLDEVIARLEGHKKRVTGLAFSNFLNILISAGADSQLCVWSDKWEKQSSIFLQRRKGRAPKSLPHTRVQFHHDHVHVLAVHETQVSIYKAPTLELVRQWFSFRESHGAITDAGYSCDSQSIFVIFEDASVGILIGTTLSLKCMINPSAYLPANPSNKIHPVVIATHPIEPNQFALGLTDGGVHVFEPLKSEANWGNPPPAELINAAGSSNQQPR